MHITTRLALALLLPAPFAGALAAVPTWSDIELQARSNLLVNDNGWNLPPGSSFNSISAAINDTAQVAFTVGVVPGAGGSHPGLWTGASGSGALVYEGPADSGISPEASINATGRIVFTMRDTGELVTLQGYPVLDAGGKLTVGLKPDAYAARFAAR